MKQLIIVLFLFNAEKILAEQFYCPDGQYFPDLYDCQKFYQCDHGSPVPKMCGPGTVYNPKIGVCDYPYNVNCPATCDPSGCAPDGAYFADSRDCRVFYQCDRGRPVRKYCGEKTVFNPRTSVCDWPYNVYGCHDYYQC